MLQNTKLHVTKYQITCYKIHKITCCKISNYMLQKCQITYMLQNTRLKYKLRYKISIYISISLDNSCAIYVIIDMQHRSHFPYLKQRK